LCARPRREGDDDQQSWRDNAHLSIVDLNRPRVALTVRVALKWALAARRTSQHLQREARFIRITAAGVRESHVHDVAIAKEAPNYRSE
jgi:hypothetical protein